MHLRLHRKKYWAFGECRKKNLKGFLVLTILSLWDNLFKVIFKWLGCFKSKTPFAYFH